MSSTKPESVVSNETPSGTRRDTLSVTDNRTGRQYELPIKYDTIRALDLRPIKLNTDDFGMMGYDQHSPTRLPVPARLLLLTAIKASYATAAIPSKNSPRKAPTSKQPT